MKKTMFLAVITACALMCAFTSCTKVYEDPFLYRENGETPASKQIRGAKRIINLPKLDVWFPDASNDGGIKSAKETFTTSGPLVAYAVSIFRVGNVDNMKAELDGREWIPLPMADFIQLQTEYSAVWSSDYWSIGCIDVPFQVNFNNSQTAQSAIVKASGALYDQQTGIQHSYAMEFQPGSWGQGQWFKVWCTHK